MPSKYGNAGFYNSKRWRQVSAAYMASKLYICERCGRPAQVCHHKAWLNDSNVHDPETALSFDNLEALCMECHNAEHGLKHNVTIFDDQGGVAEVKESIGTKELQEYRAQIDDVVERAKRLPLWSHGR